MIRAKEELTGEQAAAVEPEILTQCGICVVHSITSLDDMKAVGALGQDYLRDALQSQIKHLTGPGRTLVIDDERESVVSAQVRPLQSLHGGGSA